MIMDKPFVMSENQAVTSTGSNASTNVVDLDGGEAKNTFGTEIRTDPGKAGNIWLNVQVTEDCDSGGSATVQFVLQHDDDDSTYSNSIVLSAAIPYATLVAGYKPIRIPLPVGLQRYIRMNYAVATAALTAGKFTAFLSRSPATD